MSRPANPSWSIPVHAPDTNYPAGSDPWSGTPAKQTHPGSASVGFTPGTGVPAQCLNKLFNSAFATDDSTKTSLSGLYDYLGQVGIKNWFAPIATIDSVQVVKSLNGTYYMSGPGATGSSEFVRTTDPTTWPTSDEIGGQVILTGSVNFDVATDGSIVLSGVADVVECTSAGTWTKRTSVFANNLSASDVIYEPISGNWIVAGHRSGAAVVDFYTSTNRTSWTSRTSPSSIPNDGNNGANVTLCHNGAGVAVAQFFPSSLPGTNAVNSVSFSRSTDGGVTWSAITTKTTAFASVGGNRPFPKPVWTGTAFVAVVANTTDLDTYVYSSADGTTWTEVAHLTSTAITFIAADGALLVGVTSTGKLAYSLDNGATWKAVNASLATTYERIFAVNGGFAVTDATNDKVRHSFLCGTGGSTLT